MVKDVDGIPILVIWQKTLLRAFLVKAPFLFLEYHCYCQIEILLLTEVYKVKASRSLSNGIPIFLIVEIGILQVPKHQVLLEFEGNSQGSWSLK